MNLPTTCGQCGFYSTAPYTCHNERGYMCNCGMGYMAGKDMRDMDFSERLYPDCNLYRDIEKGKAYHEYALLGKKYGDNPFEDTSRKYGVYSALELEKIINNYQRIVGLVDDSEERYECHYCGKLITNDEGITCIGGEWVCDRASCRTDDAEGNSYIKGSFVPELTESHCRECHGFLHTTDTPEYDYWCKPCGTEYKSSDIE